MKLYTEIQMKKMFDYYGYNIDQDGCCIVDEDKYFKQKIDSLTPIELPSDEGIEEKAIVYFQVQLNKNGDAMTQLIGHGNPHGFNKFKKAFSIGYKAALEQILNQNK